MKLELHCRFSKKSLTCGSKRVNSVLVFGVSKNKEPLVVPGQDSIIVAQALENLGFRLEQGEFFFRPELYAMCSTSCSSLSFILTSRCNEPALNVNDTTITGVSPDRSNSNTRTKRSVALRSPAGITPSAKRHKDESLAREKAPQSTGDQTTARTSHRSLTFNQEGSEENGENPLTIEETMQASMNIPQGQNKPVYKVILFAC